MASTEGHLNEQRSTASSAAADHRSSDEIRRSIERQRDDLDVTAEVLQRKLAPRELAEQVWSDVRTRVSSGAGDVVGMMKRHPVPLGLIGAGIAWWIYETSSGRGFTVGNGGRYEGDDVGVGSMSTGSYRSASSYSGYSSSETGEGDYDEAGEGWRQRSVHAAQRSAQRVRSSARQAREGFSEAVDRNPLALGAACFSLGLLAAIAVPSSRWENATMGETRDRVARRAREAAKRAAVGAAEQGARAAQDAAERLKEEAQRPPSEYQEARQRSERDSAESWRKDVASSYRGGVGSTSASGESGKSGSESGGSSDPWDPNRSSF
jgi:hypothetical protein